MEKAHAVKTTEQHDAIIALQSAEPGTARELTAEEAALSETILDAEDGYVVLRGDGDGVPVWYLSDDEAPARGEALSHVEWLGGVTWPRIGPDQPADAAEKAVVQAAEDWPHRHEDVPEADDAADLAVTELLDDPAGWPRYVPAGHDPAVWVLQFRDVYADEWQSGVCADCGREDGLHVVTPEQYESGDVI